MVDIDSEVRREPVEIPVEIDPGIEVRASVSGRRMRRHPIEADETTTVTAPARLARLAAIRRRGKTRVERAEDQYG